MLEQVLAARLPMDHPIMWSIGIVSLVMWGLILHCYLRFHTLKSTNLNTQFSQKIKQYSGIQDNERLYLENGWLSEIRQHLSVGLNEIRLLSEFCQCLGYSAQWMA